MNFDFSPEQYMFKDSIESFLSETWSMNRVRALLEGDGLDAALWNQFAEMGIFAMLVPEAFDGLGLTLVDLSLIAESFGRFLVPSPILETIACTEVIAKFGSPAQKAKILPRIAAGTFKVSYAITEISTDSDPENIQLTAAARSAGLSISGDKILVPHAQNVDYFLVALKPATDAQPCLVLLEADRAGISLRSHSTLDPTSRFSELTFTETLLGPDDFLGGAPSPESLQHLLDTNSMLAATQMVGMTAKLLEDTIAYTLQRTQFGKQIAAFQAIKHRCADLAVMIETCRPAAYYAAWALAEAAPGFPRAVSIAKSACGDAVHLACNEAIQLHGGIGFTWDLGLHFYLRRAELLEILHGDAAHHRERLLTETLKQRQPLSG